MARREPRRSEADRQKAHKAFMRAFEDFMDLDPALSGSVSLHFKEGRIKRIEWRTLDDPDSWPVEEAV